MNEKYTEKFKEQTGKLKTKAQAVTSSFLERAGKQKDNVTKGGGALKAQLGNLKEKVTETAHKVKPPIFREEPKYWDTVIYIIDLDNAQTKDDIYDKMKEDLLLPQTFIGNLDALYDLFSELGDPDEQIGIIFANKSNVAFEIKDFVSRLQTVCKRVSEENPFMDTVFL